MKRLLIVEDEKMIRQGIRVMVERSPVNIEEILECKNGEEAMAILNEQSVDVMITDIRMPRMDGITLVKNTQNTPHPPKTVVISGYDDFNYAVELLRYGVRDYILKPVERNKLNEILQKLDDELEEESSHNTAVRQIGNQQLKYLILNQRISDEEIAAIERQFADMFLNDCYRICCNNYEDEPIPVPFPVILLKNIEGNSIFILSEADLPVFLATPMKNCCSGISLVHMGIRELQPAYAEALSARKEAFVKNCASTVYMESCKQYEKIPEEFSEQFVQLFGTASLEDIEKRFDALLFRVKMGKIQTQQFLDTIGNILNQFMKVYRNVIEMEMDSFTPLQQILSFNGIQEYTEILKKWMGDMKALITSEFDDYKNKEKINMAIQFIHENYNKDLNMAVVSNRISMNYSLFSLNFKQYTGLNFVNYLKKIRITEAKKLLENTDEKVIDISQKVGYDNEKHFMKTFKSLCGVSPSEYRKNISMGGGTKPGGNEFRRG